MNTKQIVRNFIASNFYVPDSYDLRDTSSLLESGIVDSTGMLEMIAFLEETFAVTVSDADMVPENLDSIDRITSYVARKAA